jgi:uncharacterized protein
MATKTSHTKQLFMVWKLNNGKNFTVSLKQPKDDLTSEDVAPVMQSAVDNNVFLVGTARVAEAVDAYVRDTTKLDLNTEGV